MRTSRCLKALLEILLPLLRLIPFSLQYAYFCSRSGSFPPCGISFDRDSVLGIFKPRARFLHLIQVFLEYLDLGLSSSI